MRRAIRCAFVGVFVGFAAWQAEHHNWFMVALDGALVAFYLLADDAQFWPLRAPKDEKGGRG